MLTVLVANQPEDLLDHLVAGLSAPHSDPFATDWVTVANPGMRNWVQQQLALRLGASGASDGIAANIDYPQPGTLRWRVLDAYREHLGGQADATDPWQVDRLTWTILEVLSNPSSGLEERLRRTPPGVTLASRARPIAELFDRYAVHRPGMLLEWLSGNDVSGDGAQLDASRLWQPALFRLLRDQIAAKHGVAETASQRLVAALELIRVGSMSLAGSARTSLPQRMFVFGQTMLPAELGPVLQVLADHREVTVMLLSPSADVTRMLASSDGARSSAFSRNVASWSFPRPFALTEFSEHGVDHPMLSAWGARVFDSGLLLGAGAIVPDVVLAAPRFSQPEAPTLLERLHTDLHAGKIAETPHELAPGDCSVQVHAAPGHARQIEVLRDVLLGLLRDNPDLTESDIAVVCPQLDAYGPVLGAVLGASAERNDQPVAGRVPALRYTVVDKSARSFNPILDAMAQILDLLPGRFDVVSVRSVLAAPAIRQRFGLTGDDLSLVGTLAEDAGVRWGIDGPHRAKWDITPDHRANSWVAGLDQLMMGVALGDSLRDAVPPGSTSAEYPSDHFDLAVGGIAVMPLGDGDMSGAGRLSAAVRSLAEAHRVLITGGSRPIEQWATDLLGVADLLVSPAWTEDWQRTRFDEAVAGLVAASCDANNSPSPLKISFGDVRKLLSPSLEGPAARSDLGFGTIAISRPSLLASVPHKVVCILGLDADALPTGRVSGDDLMAFAPAVGDRDARADARADLLSAVLSARTHLVVTCSSRDIRTNAEVPRAVVTDELLDVLATTLGRSTADLESGPNPPYRTHPRQAFSPSNFQATAAGIQPFGFDPVAMSGAQAMGEMKWGVISTDGPDVLVPEPLGDADPTSTPVSLDDVRRFYRHPVKAFFKQRLNVVVPHHGDAAEVGLPTSIGHRERASLGAAIFEAAIDLANPSLLAVSEVGDLPVEVLRVVDSYGARGMFPPDHAANAELVKLTTEIAVMLALARDAGVLQSAAESSNIDLTMADGGRIIGVVDRCNLSGPHPGPLRVHVSKFRPRHRIELAIDVLALTAAAPELPWQGVLVARSDKKDTEGNSIPMCAAWKVAGDSPQERQATALRALGLLLDQLHVGTQIALPLFEKTSLAKWQGKSIATAWNSSTFAGEDVDPYHVKAFGRLKASQVEQLDIAGHTLESEAEHLWGTLDEALVDVNVDASADSSLQGAS